MYLFIAFQRSANFITFNYWSRLGGSNKGGSNVLIFSLSRTLFVS